MGNLSSLMATKTFLRPDGSFFKKEAPAKPPSPLQLGTVAELVHIPPASWKLLVAREFVQKMLLERNCVSELMEMIEYMCWEDVAWTEYWFALLVDGVKRAKLVDTLGGFLLGFEALMAAADSMQAARVQDVGKFLMQMMERAAASRSKSSAAEVMKYSVSLVSIAKAGPAAHPLRKFVLSKEREINELRMEAGECVQ